MDTLKNIIESINNLKVKDLKIYETKNITPFFDYVVIATAISSRQLKAVVEHLRKDSQEKNLIIKGIEGLDGGYWALVDLGDVLVNVFTSEEREKYDLDRLWKSLPQIDPNSLL